MTPDEVAKKVKEILGTSDRIKIEVNDPKIQDIVGELHRARVRLPLAKEGISVDFPSSGSTIEIYKIGAAASSAVPDSKKAPDAKTPKPRPKAKRHKHSFVRHRMMGDIIDAVADDASHVILFKGRTGTGKTVTARQIAEELDMSFFQTNCYEGMAWPDLVGEMTVAIDPSTGQNHIVFIPGILVRAMTAGLDDDGNEVGRPGLLLMDELGAMPPGLGIGLNPFFESDNPRRRIMVVTENGPKEIRSHSGFRIILSANTALRGATDMSEAMHTAQMDALDISLINRIALVFNFGYDREVEKHILQQKIGDDKIVSMVLKYRDAIRNLLKQGSISTPFSTRHLVKIADAYRVYGDLGKAIYLTVYEFLLPEEKAKYNEVAFNLFRKDLLKEYQQDGIDFI